MDDHVVEALGYALGVRPAPVEVDRFHLGCPRHLRTLEAVVRELRDGEEVLRTLDHLPDGLDTEVVHQGHLREEQLRHPSTEGRGVDVEHLRTREWSRGLAQPLHSVRSGCLPIVVQTPLRDGHDGQHRPEVYPVSSGGQIEQQRLRGGPSL